MLYLLFFIIVVGASQQVTKNELRDIHLLFFVNLNWDTISIVPNTDGVVLLDRSAGFGRMLQTV